MQGLKKSGKGLRKVLKTGFVAMGNTMIHASLTSPQVYELGLSNNITSTNLHNEYDYDHAKYDKEYEVYRKKYVEFYSRRQNEFNRIDASNYEYHWWLGKALVFSSFATSKIKSKLEII